MSHRALLLSSFFGADGPQELPAQLQREQHQVLEHCHHPERSPQRAHVAPVVVHCSAPLSVVLSESQLSLLGRPV